MAPASSRYEGLIELGRGGMGKVLLARARGASGFERLVALKRMNPELLDAGPLVARFIDEARVAAHVRHGNVVAVHDFGCDDEGPFLVLDYVEGASLDALLARCLELGTWLDPAISLRIVADALAGLHAVHETCDATGQALNILHRDVSTQNVLVGCDGLARLSDFGIAKSVLGRQRTAQHEILGKPLYMAPEYLRHERVDRTLDVYAIGITLFIALAGVEPWNDVSDATLISCILHEELPPLDSGGVRVAPELETLVRRATARDPRDRYQTAAAMGQALVELSRRTGWMATHLEVAETVETLCGDSLRRVRGLVRDAHISSLPPALPTHALGTPPSARNDANDAPVRERRWSSAPAGRIRVVPPKNR